MDSDIEIEVSSLGEEDHQEELAYQVYRGENSREQGKSMETLLQKSKQ